MIPVHCLSKRPGSAVMSETTGLGTAIWQPVKRTAGLRIWKRMVVTRSSIENKYLMRVSSEVLKYLRRKQECVLFIIYRITTSKYSMTPIMSRFDQKTSK
jgi:hypothetical protein